MTFMASTSCDVQPGRLHATARYQVSYSDESGCLRQAIFGGSADLLTPRIAPAYIGAGSPRGRLADAFTLTTGEDIHDLEGARAGGR